MVREGKKSRIDLEQRDSDKLGRAECISESRGVMRKVRGPGSGAPIRTFRPEDPSMTQKQSGLQDRHSLQLIVDGIHPSTHPPLQSSGHPPTCPVSTHPSTNHPSIQQINQHSRPGYGGTQLKLVPVFMGVSSLPSAGLEIPGVFKSHPMVTTCFTLTISPAWGVCVCEGGGGSDRFLKEL